MLSSNYSIAIIDFSESKVGRTKAELQREMYKAISGFTRKLVVDLQVSDLGKDFLEFLGNSGYRDMDYSQIKEHPWLADYNATVEEQQMMWKNLTLIFNN